MDWKYIAFEKLSENEIELKLWQTCLQSISASVLWGINNADSLTNIKVFSIVNFHGPKLT